MVQPFVFSTLPKRGILSHVLKKSEPEIARCEINNILSSTKDIFSITKEMVSEILFQKNHVKTQEIPKIIVPIFRKLVVHVLEDAVLTQDEIKQVKHLKEILDIPSDLANSIVKTIGKSRYDLAKEEVESDIQITTEEREKLQRLKKQLGLEVHVPEVGWVWSVFYQKWESNLRDKVEGLVLAKEKFLKICEQRPDIDEHLMIKMDIDEIEGLIISGDELLLDIKDIKENDFEGLNEMIDMNDEMDMDLLNGYAEKLKNAYQLMSGPIIDPDSDMKKLISDDGFRRETIEKRVRKCGYNPKGTIKQRKWAFDIIGEEWFDTKFGKKCEKLLLSKNPKTKKEEDLLFWLDSLKEKSCGWWIGKSNEDMEEVYEKALKKMKKKCLEDGE